MSSSHRVRVVAILATYNEERFIRGCIEHLIGQGVCVYLIDNCSTDRTVEIAREYLGRGVVGIETFPRREGIYRWQAILERKEELASTLEADWFMHVDADEIRLPPRADQTLAEAFAEVEEAGYNAVDFQEFVFVPTRESPDHDHPDYQRTMRWYYPFSPSSSPHRVNAWRQQSGPVGLADSGGHKLSFPGMKLYPVKFPMKHYLFLSGEHLLQKYGNRSFEKAELDRGWHSWRARLNEENIVLPSQDELKTYTSDQELDPSNPRRRHMAEDWAFSGREWWPNREGIGEYAIRWKWVTKPSSSGFTAVMRVKNEAQSIPWVLPGVLRSVEEVVLVDNLSTDGTPDLAHQVAGEEGLEEKLRVLSYPFEVSRCGPEHLATYPDSVHSLTYFYNWSFSHVRTRYALKWDGDMVLSPQGERVLRDLSWQLEGSDGTVRMCRSPVYVESSRVAYVDLGTMPHELWGWRNSPDHTFIKGFDWEIVRPWAENLLQIPDWTCFELKWLDQDQFDHWSHTDFQTERHRRKWREWDVSRALLSGAAPPEGVVRIESPEGIHVVEHLRQVYVALRRYGVIAPVPGLSDSGGIGLPVVEARGESDLSSTREAIQVPQSTQSREISHE